jgi:hypothetical protein
VFITQTGPKKTKEAQSQIRRHVMRDIGKSRRKDGKRAIPLRFTLEVPDSLETLTRPEIDQPLNTMQHLRDSRTVGTHFQLLNRSFFNPSEVVDPLDEIEEAMQHEADQPVTVKTPSIERLWTGRMDPFIKYPIRMDQYSLRLMDHGKFDSSSYFNLIDLL